MIGKRHPVLILCACCMSAAVSLPSLCKDKDVRRIYSVSASHNQFTRASSLHPPKVKVMAGEGTDIVDITSDYFHGSGTVVSLKQGKWPKKMRVQLHASDGTAYKMLDYFSMQTGLYKVDLQYGRKTRFPLYQKNRNSGEWVQVSTVEASVQFNEKYMSVSVPEELLKTTPRFIKFTWVYMYSVH